ncbi:MAG TPA: FAD-dependent oxidoreductase, partial [Anaerolineales bacterium]|nr:FAD-dependent oxidoreductase [Anaerolineales bacterium]
MNWPHITILGGGPAGLAAAYYARKSGMPFTLYEARHQTGGNAITLRHGDFRFDSGAHRFHDKDPEVTRDLKELLGSELVEVDAPSHVHSRSRLVEFPLTPGNLALHLGLPKTIQAAIELAVARLKPDDGRRDFESRALHMYGRTIAEAFLLNYSKKLWGLPTRQLSPGISGSRLAHLSVGSLLRDALLGPKGGARHLEGRFLYPQDGYGEIAEALGRASGGENIRTDSPARSIQHDGSRIQAVMFGGEPVSVQTVINTIPLPLFLRIMTPAPPEEILSVARSLRFRNIVLVALFLDQERGGA